MITKKFTLSMTLLCLTILLGGLTAVYAQGPNEEESQIAIATSGRLDVTFEQLGYDTKQLNRLRKGRSYAITIPGNFQISPTGNYLDLVTYHFPEIPDKPSVLKVEVNNRLLHTSSLTGSNAISHTIHITLPNGLLQVGYNYVQVDLDTSHTCEDPGALLDVFIDPASSINFGYQQKPYPVDLSLYPFPFIETSLLNIPVALVLPDHPTSNDLAAAATIAAGLGQMSGGAIDLTTVLANELGPDVQNNYHLIVIGQPNDNSLLDDLPLPLPINSSRLDPEQGILEEIPSPWNEFRLILVVSGLDDAGVSKASHALNRKAHFLGMRGRFAIVTQLRAIPGSSISRLPGMILTDLGYEDEIVYGAQPQDHTFYFTLPLGWQLEAFPSFTLEFTHADILDPQESAMDIVLNGIPIGSTLLDRNNAVEGELTVSLPGRLLKSGRNRLTIGIEMNFPASTRDKCKDLLDERAWTVISSESEIFLPYQAIDLPPDLSLLPYPFSQYSGFDQTLLVLPDQPISSTFFDDLMRLSVLLGSSSQKEYISAHVAYASEVNQQDRESHHLILLGRPTEQPLLREANTYLPQPFIPDSNLLEPLTIDSVAFLPDPERDAGLLEISASPWNSEYSLLAITGTTAEGVRLAVQAMLKSDRNLKGNLAVAEPIFDPLSDTLVQISAYSLDTRPPMSGASNTVTSDTSEADFDLMAERWWK